MFIKNAFVILLVMFLFIAGAFNTSYAIEGSTLIKVTISGTSAEVNGGTVVLYEPTEVPMRVLQITIHSDTSETGTIDIKLDSAEGATYDCVIKTATFVAQTDYFANFGDSSPILYVKKTSYSTLDKLVFDGTSISGNIYITLLVEPLH